MQIRPSVNDRDVQRHLEWTAQFGIRDGADSVIGPVESAVYEPEPPVLEPAPAPEPRQSKPTTKPPAVVNVHHMPDLSSLEAPDKADLMPTAPSAKLSTSKQSKTNKRAETSA